MKSIAPLIVALALIAHFPPAFGGTAEGCKLDLQSIPAFLIANDAGGRDAWERRGQEHFDKAMKEAIAAASSATDSATCRTVLRSYLNAWRAGHLGVIDANPVPAKPRVGQPPAPRSDKSPTVRFLSARTALLVFPSFSSSQRQAVVQMFKANRKELARHPHWIIDVRGNGGGSDDVYAEVLRWIGPTWQVEVQVEYLVTAANIEATNRLCDILDPGDKHCEEAMREERLRMESAPLGSWVLQQPAPPARDVRLATPEAVRPGKVAILVDGRCGSSCEEFLLSARQSFTVKLIGQHTQGVLDVSNMRPHVLPSGERVLMYAVTRSRRIPGLPVDGIGVMPDVYVPTELTGLSGDALITSVQRWLEGGRLIGEPASAR